MKQLLHINTHNRNVIIYIFSVLCLIAPDVFAQNFQVKPQRIILSSVQKRYADTAIPEILKIPRYGRIFNLQQEFSLTEKQGLRPQVEEWFGILSSSVGENTDETLINQNKRLLDIDKLQHKTTRFPISKDDALEYAVKLTQRGYTLESTSILVEKYGINIIDKLIDIDFPSSHVLLSDVIVVGQVDTTILVEKYNSTGFFNRFFQKRYLIQIQVKNILKGPSNLKSIYLVDRYIDDEGVFPLFDAPEQLKTKEVYVFFLHQIGNAPIENLYGTAYMDVRLSNHKNTSEGQVSSQKFNQVNLLCEKLSDFFHSYIK